MRFLGKSFGLFPCHDSNTFLAPAHFPELLERHLHVVLALDVDLPVVLGGEGPAAHAAGEEPVGQVPGLDVTADVALELGGVGVREAAPAARRKGPQEGPRRCI